MIEKEFTLAVMLHARPAGLAARAAKKFDSGISISFGDKTSDAKSIIGLMSLGAKKGDAVKLRASGSDEEEAIKSIENILTGEQQ